MDKDLFFKNFNMGNELETAGEFLYDSAQKMMRITGIHNYYEINSILYSGSVGIERLQKIYLCLALPNPTESIDGMDCLLKHNHLELEKNIEKFCNKKLPKNEMGLLGLFADYYNNFRYANFTPGFSQKELQKLFQGFLKKCNGKFDFDTPYAAVQFETFIKFYINELGKTIQFYYNLIDDKARELNIYTYEISSASRAYQVYWACNNGKLYEYMKSEANAVRELMLYIFKSKSTQGVFRLLNELEPIQFDDSFINEYLSDLCRGKINDNLVDWVYEMYSEAANEDIKKQKEREDAVSLIGNTSVDFYWDEKDDSEDGEECDATETDY